jgi:hypothetical protein
MAQSEEYEIWIQEHGNWGLKAWSLDFDLAWALARVHSIPLRIVRTVCDGTSVIEKTVIAELQIPQTAHAQPFASCAPQR